MTKSAPHVTPVPTQWVGPIEITGDVVNEAVSVPLATYETPLWPSTARGARVSRQSGGIRCTVVDERMTRSIALRARTAADAHAAWVSIEARREELDAVVQTTSRFARLVGLNRQIVGNLLYVRFECATGDASGHNMVTKAADALQGWILQNYPSLDYATISGNFCTDKKTSAVNGLLGRGKYVVAEIDIPRKICTRMLRTTPEKMVQLNTEKNLIGGVVAGSLRSANAHFANMLLGFYLATGQDAANIIEGSQGIVHCEARENGLYFSCTLPNLIVGSVGNGKSNDAVEDHLQQIGCREDRAPGENARRLAVLCAATVLCGELSLMAAQTNPGELMRAHLLMER
ncbi:3-hydroxy-3-methylglutaryl-coenzyme A reductase [Actibacterium atlanticum]|uniref:3-hydroxy-3-methylglutaryl-coenzyme A reductase n=1 Tax=Actibacterium atlanticum TaxID=1461693 RepID=A0A058ZJN1_9RHOB|nr:hydroxymethylglutaryl-CoA reductase [Actibacterium atlanticum]KCV81748.1 3-hydroxy-3-methylglutaryl-coenzyme A reductase [Actibacterium atlanticum]